MRFYTQQHKHYCGIDLHARSLYVCILDQAGKTLVHRKLPCDRNELLKTLKPYPIFNSRLPDYRQRDVGLGPARRWELRRRSAPKISGR
jgi:hypothetical protein